MNKEHPIISRLIGQKCNLIFLLRTLQIYSAQFYHKEIISQMDDQAWILSYYCLHSCSYSSYILFAIVGVIIRWFLLYFLPILWAYFSGLVKIKPYIITSIRKAYLLRKAISNVPIFSTYIKCSKFISPS